ncbi:MAG TPA: hypothetical protein PLY70_01120 [Saprospiraceae bacterium]|nr:hypothetical protein [Saprospiraceae bacterium]HPN68189.1 hypothetical protein [Saprospiraceae bacterium]
MCRSAGTLIAFSFAVHGLKSMVTTWIEPLALDYIEYGGPQDHMGRSTRTLIVFSYGVHGLKSMVTKLIEPLALDFIEY